MAEDRINYGVVAEFRVALVTEYFAHFTNSSWIVFHEEEIINDPSERRGFLFLCKKLSDRRIKMDTIVIFEKEMNTHEKEEARRKWKNPGGEAMCRSFIFVFRTKQIKYRAHSDTGHCITFGCTS